MFFKIFPLLILISVITFSLGFISYLCLLLLIYCKLIFLSRPLTVGTINILCLGSSLFNKCDPCDLSPLTPVALVPTINYIFLFQLHFFWLLYTFTYSVLWMHHTEYVSQSSIHHFFFFFKVLSPPSPCPAHLFFKTHLRYHLILQTSQLRHHIFKWKSRLGCSILSNASLKINFPHETSYITESWTNKWWFLF